MKDGLNKKDNNFKMLHSEANMLLGKRGTETITLMAMLREPLTLKGLLHNRVMIKDSQKHISKQLQPLPPGIQVLMTTIPELTVKLIRAAIHKHKPEVTMITRTTEHKIKTTEIIKAHNHIHIKINQAMTRIEATNIKIGMDLKITVTEITTNKIQLITKRNSRINNRDPGMILKTQPKLPLLIKGMLKQLLATKISPLLLQKKVLLMEKKAIKQQLM